MVKGDNVALSTCFALKQEAESGALLSIYINIDFPVLWEC